MPGQLWGDLVMLLGLVIALGCASWVNRYIEQMKIEPVKTQSEVTAWLLTALVITMAIKVIVQFAYYGTGGLPCTLGY